MKINWKRCGCILKVEKVEKVGHKMWRNAKIQESLVKAEKVWETTREYANVWESNAKSRQRMLKAEKEC